MDEWLKDEILNGLSRLLCLSLERTPAADMIAGTAAMWVEVFAAGRLLDRDLDAPRIRQAFRTLAATRDTWPAPRHFVEAFNATTRQQAALTKQHVPARPETVAAAVAEVEAVFRVDGKTLAAGGD